MFVSDLLKNARPEEDAPSVQSKGSSIYDRIREEQRRIENEWFIVENKKKDNIENACPQKTQRRNCIGQNRNLFKTSCNI